MAKNLIERDEYKGNPLVVFKDGPDDNWPFSFGATKARKLLAAIKRIGPEKFVVELEEFVSG